MIFFFTLLYSTEMSETDYWYNSTIVIQQNKH